MQLANENINLLNKKDIEFLYNYETEISNIESKLSSQKNKKENVLNIISKSIDKSNLSKANEILNVIEENIGLLTSLRNDLLNLDSFIVDFMITLNSTTSSESKEIEIFQNRINDASANSANAESKIFVNDMKIDAFINYNTNIEKDHVMANGIRPDVYNMTLQNMQAEHIEDSNTLIISEKKKTVFLPYTKNDLQKYYSQFPKSYKNLKDVIQKQFILPIDYFKYYSVSRFREGYSLLRNREGKAILDSLKFGISLMFKSNLHPAIIAACKTKDDLNEYMDCLENNRIKDFNRFIIKFEITPLKV